MKLNFLLFVLLIALAALFVFSCGDDDDDDSSSDDDDSADDDDVSDDDVTDDDDDDFDQWTPVEPKKTKVGRYTLAWYNGTPYEMGYQQGELLHDELAAGVEWLGPLVTILPPIANLIGLTDLAMSNSYQDIIDECQGLVDAAGDVGWTMDICIILNFGDVAVEFLSEGWPEVKAFQPGCSQVSAAGDATFDGNLYHGRNLDWGYISYLYDYPVIHIRQPSDGIPHMYVGFPGNLSPYNGMNIEGIVSASNEADPRDNTVHDLQGRSHVQMQAQLLKYATSLDDAVAMVEDTDHMTVEGIMVSDGKSKTAAAFEMTGAGIGIRYMQDGVVHLTNHFIADETKDLDEGEGGRSSRNRLKRLQQLTLPDGDYTVYGDIDPLGMVNILRDRTNPDTLDESPVGTFDDGNSIATNGAVYQIVFDPANLCFWVAAGNMPVYTEPFTGFSLGALLELPGAVDVEPDAFE